MINNEVDKALAWADRVGSLYPLENREHVRTLAYEVRRLQAIADDAAKLVFGPNAALTKELETLREQYTAVCDNNRLLTRAVKAELERDAFERQANGLFARCAVLRGRMKRIREWAGEDDA